MHLKQQFPKVQKYKTSEKDLINNKIKKNKINKDSIEFKKIYILSPTINIANKQCYIFEPLKTDLTNKTQKRNIKIINSNKDNLNNNINDEDILLNMEKIKVRLNSIKRINKNNNNNNNNNNDSEKKNKTINKIRKICPRTKNSKTVIFNYSYLDNIMNKNNKNKSELFYSIQNSFESPKEKVFQKNKNESYGNYFTKTYEKNFHLPGNKNYSYNTNKIINRYNDIKKIKNETYLYRNNKFHKIMKTKNSLANESIKNLKFNNIRNTSPIDTERIENKNCITKSNYLKNSNSFKSFNKEKIENSKLKFVKKFLRNKYDNDNSLFSPKYNKIQNTYQKKLIKKHIIKIDNNDFDNNTFKFDNSIIRDKSKDDKEKTKNDKNNLYDSQNNIFNSPKKNESSNDVSIFGIINTKIRNENINNKNNKNNNIIISKSKIQSTIYNKNKNLYNHFNYNKDKVDIEQNIISDNNYSTSNSFYHSQKNYSNSSTSKNLISSIKLEHKLKNIITSIDYKNTNSNSKYHNQNKNVILYEYDKEGKINCKIREMKNSVEKIIRENSNSKFKKSNIIEDSPKKQKKGIISLYVKKNQGTILRKNKNKNKIEFYNPCLKQKK